MNILISIGIFFAVLTFLEFIQALREEIDEYDDDY